MEFLEHKLSSVCISVLGHGNMVGCRSPINHCGGFRSGKKCPIGFSVTCGGDPSWILDKILIAMKVAEDLYSRGMRLFLTFCQAVCSGFKLEEGTWIQWFRKRNGGMGDLGIPWGGEIFNWRPFGRSEHAYEPVLPLHPFFLAAFICPLFPSLFPTFSCSVAGFITYPRTESTKYPAASQPRLITLGSLSNYRWVASMSSLQGFLRGQPEVTGVQTARMQDAG